MDPERWKQIEQLCEAALERDESQRAEFLKQACGEDQELRREVESLLRHQKKADGAGTRPFRIGLITSIIS